MSFASVPFQTSPPKPNGGSVAQAISSGRREQTQGQQLQRSGAKRTNAPPKMLSPLQPRGSPARSTGRDASERSPGANLYGAYAAPSLGRMMAHQQRMGEARELGDQLFNAVLAFDAVGIRAALRRIEALDATLQQAISMVGSQVMVDITIGNAKEAAFSDNCLLDAQVVADAVTCYAMHDAAKLRSCSALVAQLGLSSAAVVRCAINRLTALQHIDDEAAGIIVTLRNALDATSTAEAMQQLPHAARATGDDAKKQGKDMHAIVETHLQPAMDVGRQLIARYDALALQHPLPSMAAEAACASRLREQLLLSLFGAGSTVRFALRAVAAETSASQAREAARLSAEAQSAAEAEAASVAEASNRKVAAAKEECQAARAAADQAAVARNAAEDEARRMDDQAQAAMARASSAEAAAARSERDAEAVRQRAATDVAAAHSSREAAEEEARAARKHAIQVETEAAVEVAEAKQAQQRAEVEAHDQALRCSKANQVAEQERERAAAAEQERRTAMSDAQAEAQRGENARLQAQESMQAARKANKATADLQQRVTIADAEAAALRATLKQTQEKHDRESSRALEDLVRARQALSAAEARTKRFEEELALTTEQREADALQHAARVDRLESELDGHVSRSNKAEAELEKVHQKLASVPAQKEPLSVAGSETVLQPAATNNSPGRVQGRSPQRHSGRESEFEATFEQGPLGFGFSRLEDGTFEIERVSGQSEAKGMRVGDVMVAVNDRSLDGFSKQDFLRLIQATPRPFRVRIRRIEQPSSPLQTRATNSAMGVTPHKRSGRAREFEATFATGPLGFGFSRLKDGTFEVVQRVSGQAEEQGLALNDRLLSVAGQSVDGLSKQDFLHHVQTAARPLRVTLLRIEPGTAQSTSSLDGRPSPAPSKSQAPPSGFTSNSDDSDSDYDFDGATG